MKKSFEATDFIAFNFESSDGPKRITVEPGDVVQVISKSAYQKELIAKTPQRKKAVSSTPIKLVEI